MIPRGQRVTGHVSSVEQGFHARMLISFDEIDTGHGKMPLIATLTGLPSEHGVKQPDSEGEIERKGMSNRHMIETVAVGAGMVRRAEPLQVAVKALALAPESARELAHLPAISPIAI